MQHIFTFTVQMPEISGRGLQPEVLAGEEEKVFDVGTIDRCQISENVGEMSKDVRKLF
ncbi:hypothetical protein [Microcoleus sp. MON2_D5]|uniref:hypothetical protein n=1 Tax=Microcoleus sp. MON2_D5 TaxID=2818833 RepID=UPI002FD7021A